VVASDPKNNRLQTVTLDAGHDLSGQPEEKGIDHEEEEAERNQDSGEAEKNQQPVEQLGERMPRTTAKLPRCRRSEPAIAGTIFADRRNGRGAVEPKGRRNITCTMVHLEGLERPASSSAKPPSESRDPRLTPRPPESAPKTRARITLPHR